MDTLQDALALLVSAADAEKVASYATKLGGVGNSDKLTACQALIADFNAFVVDVSQDHSLLGKTSIACGQSTFLTLTGFCTSLLQSNRATLRLTLRRCGSAIRYSSRGTRICKSIHTRICLQVPVNRFHMARFVQVY